MWSIIFIIILTSVATNEQDGIEVMEEQIKSSKSAIMSSFTKFKNQVTTFFKYNLNKVQYRKIKIKNAFYKFLEGAFGNDNKTTTQMPNNVSTTTIKVEKLVNEFTELPDITFEKLVQSHGYKAQTHIVVSTDGYFLTLYRILPRNEKPLDGNNDAVLLHHGFLGSCEDWVLLGPEKALPYMLLKADYEVWLTNARGNKYSREHASENINQKDFWNFSWHEMGQYDLPAVIDYIKERSTNNINLHFVGHSMGCTAVLVLLSTYPQYNHILKSAILLAPMAYMYEIKGPLRLLAEFYREYEYESLDFLKYDDSPLLRTLPRDLIDKYCLEDKSLCENPLLFFANGGQPIANKTLRQEIQSHSPAGASVKTFIHYIQLVKSGQFQMYNLGQKRNLKKYGTEYPPIYRLNDVTLPVAVFGSSDDWLSTLPDIHSLTASLPKVIMQHVVTRNDFSHTDFVWAEDADILVYYLVLDVLKEIRAMYQ